MIGGLGVMHIGDSITAGQYVNRGDRWTAVVERRLRLEFEEQQARTAEL